MFSAVALVAFSFAGTANNEVEKKESKNEETTEKMDICMDAAFSFLAVAEEQGDCEYSFTEQQEIINGFYAVCVYANLNYYYSGLPADSY